MTVTHDKQFDEYATVDVDTIDHIHYPQHRTVTLFYNKADGRTTLMGKLPHGDEIVITQELVDDLQELVNMSKGVK